jgi:hypothetical protein
MPAGWRRRRGVNGDSCATATLGAFGALPEFSVPPLQPPVIRGVPRTAEDGTLPIAPVLRCETCISHGRSLPTPAAARHSAQVMPWEYVSGFTFRAFRFRRSAAPSCARSAAGQANQRRQRICCAGVVVSLETGIRYQIPRLREWRRAPACRLGAAGRPRRGGVKCSRSLSGMR